MKYTSLRALLENETYPHFYTHKFIGLHTPIFLEAVETLKSKFAYLTLSTQFRSSAKGDYIAFTITFMAATVDDILTIMEATSQLPDLKIIL